MEETKSNPIEALVTEARQRIAESISAKAGQLDDLDKSFQELRDHQKKLQEEIERQLDHLAGQSMQELRDQHKKLEETVQRQLDQLAAYQPPPPPAPVAPLDKLLNSVRNLITATLPEQVLEVLTEEAVLMGVRAAVFDVRGKSAWGSSAHGFDLSEKTFRGLVVPLNQENPFRQTFETGDSVTTTADHLKKNRNILDKLKPGKEDEILLLPVRSAGSVSAILYTDNRGKDSPLPVDALKILSEFAGAQLDRLMALSGGGPEETEEKKARLPEPEQEHEREEDQESAAAPETAQAEPEPAKQEPWEEAVNQGAARQASESAAVEEKPAPPPAPEPIPEAPPPPAPGSAAPDVSQLSEEEQKYHKDAKRFAKLLVSEIDLYNKTKVADGRKNKDLYKRLKSDIERSRLTFQKRFAKTAGKQFDYFHEELIRTLATNDASLMGPEYPGSSA